MKMQRLEMKKANYLELCMSAVKGLESAFLQSAIQSTGRNFCKSCSVLINGTPSRLAAWAPPIMCRKFSGHKPRRVSVSKSQNGHAKSCPKETVGVMDIIAKYWADYCSTWKQTSSMMKPT